MIRRLPAIVAVPLACVLAIALAGASGEDDGVKIRIAFDNAFGITEGGDLRVGGVNAGQTTSVRPSHGAECQNPSVAGPPRTCAVVEARVTKPGFTSFRSDARCSVRQQSLIGEYYVDCQPGRSAQPLPGGLLPVTRTTSTIPLDLLNNIARRPARERLRLIIAELGTGFAGRSEDLAEVLRRAHPGLRETDETLRILAHQTEAIERFISDSDVVIGKLERQRRNVARWVHEAGRTAEVSASRRGDIAATFERLPRFLDGLRPTMAGLERFTDEQLPLLDDLRAAAPDLERVFARLGPFADASAPALRALGDASVKGERALRESADEVDELRGLARGAPGLAKPLRQLLQTLDDRSRALRPDPRAAETAPPAPDPTADAKGKGFTGFEDLWSYFFWQTLAVNRFDSTSHLLLTNIFRTECSQYTADARDVSGKRAFREKCNSYLGPYQPGVTDPDPTLEGTAAAERRGAGGRRARRRGAGDPEAPPVPGRRDPSQPHVVPPLGAPQPPATPQSPAAPTAPGLPALPELPPLPEGADPQAILDFLLGP
jgi:ABC-type transporter Mla subunit MlaD